MGIYICTKTTIAKIPCIVLRICINELFYQWQLLLLYITAPISATEINFIYYNFFIKMAT